MFDSSSYDNPTPLARADTSRDVLPRGGTSQGVKSELEEKGISFKKDQGERHTGTTGKRRPLIRSAPRSWTQTNNRTKRERKETLAYKRSLNSRSGGPERKQRKGPPIIYYLICYWFKLRY
ncbi:hypothetical protein TNCV_3908601 [Trichonephila clavipes]|nr:hypothetical protein TNCV_3908601 [Trichonephila clavipes]